MPTALADPGGSHFTFLLVHNHFTWIPSPSTTRTGFSVSLLGFVVFSARNRAFCDSGGRLCLCIDVCGLIGERVENGGEATEREADGDRGRREGGSEEEERVGSSVEASEAIHVWD